MTNKDNERNVLSDEGYDHVRRHRRSLRPNDASGFEKAAAALVGPATRRKIMILAKGHRESYGPSHPFDKERGRQALVKQDRPITGLSPEGRELLKNQHRHVARGGVSAFEKAYAAAQQKTKPNTKLKIIAKQEFELSHQRPFDPARGERGLQQAKEKFRKLERRLTGPSAKKAGL
ncbi:hypothetical protein ACFL2C_04165 [Patescibacteria group bacterium]